MEDLHGPARMEPISRSGGILGPRDRVVGGMKRIMMEEGVMDSLLGMRYVYFAWTKRFYFR